jgi:hypothetical protein
MRIPLPAALASISIAAALGGGLDQDEAFIGARRNYWAFRAPARPEVPAQSSTWVANPVDAFILDALATKKLTPSPAAPPEKLVRRLYLDVVGLPPSPDEARAAAASSWESTVDRLMASPQYGERMALKWLDVVRYADTNGFEADAERPDAWRYRDYVIRSFNQDKPYDRFLREQIASDELYPADKEALLGLGFLRAGPRHVVGGNQDKEMSRQEDLVEMTGSIGSTFLGLTVGCARCHNHKFDPILQSDYYRLQAVFAATDFKDIPTASKQEMEEYEAAKKAYEARLKPATDQIAAIEKPYRERLREEKIAHLDPEHAAALRVPKKERTPEQKSLAKDAEAQVKLTWDEVVHALSPEDRDKRAGLRREMHRIELEKPRQPAKAQAVEDMATDPPETYILKVGDYHHKLDRVPPGFPKVIADGAAAPETAAGRRAALANWLASPENPLTARVIVNRIWQYRMGVGLVATPNDFGVLGGNPSNRKLLDWLAVEFMSHGWSVKHIDRLILLSSAYRESTADDPAKSAVDPENKLYWRANRRRLDAESLRDSVLAASGLLNPKMGGPAVRVPIAKEVYDLIFTEGEPDNLWPLDPDKTQQYRRSIYLLNKRTVRLPMLANFDQPDDMTSCPVRPASTHSLQALSLLNSDFMQEQSQAFASRLEGRCGRDRGCAVKLAYELTLARTPRKQEMEMARSFFHQDKVLADFCLALLNRNEFVYVP